MGGNDFEGNLGGIGSFLVGVSLKIELGFVDFFKQKTFAYLNQLRVVLGILYAVRSTATP